LFVHLFFLEGSVSPIVGDCSFGVLIVVLISCGIIRKNISRHFFIFPTLAGVLFLMLPTIGSAAIERLDNHRIEVWQRFLQLAKERPILGYGERLEFFIEISDGANLGHALNIFISALMRGGFISVLCFVLAYAKSLLKTYEFARQFQNPIPLALILLIFSAGFVDFDQLFFLADWQWVSFWMPLGFAVACEMRLRVERMNLRERSRFYF